MSTFNRLFKCYPLLLFDDAKALQSRTKTPYCSVFSEVLFSGSRLLISPWPTPWTPPSPGRSHSSRSPSPACSCSSPSLTAHPPPTSGCTCTRGSSDSRPSRTCLAGGSWAHESGSVSRRAAGRRSRLLDKVRQTVTGCQTHTPNSHQKRLWHVCGRQHTAASEVSVQTSSYIFFFFYFVPINHSRKNHAYRKSVIVNVFKLLLPVKFGLAFLSNLFLFYLYCQYVKYMRKIHAIMEQRKTNLITKCALYERWLFWGI